MIICTLWLEFGFLFGCSHSYSIYVSEESFDSFMNELLKDYKIDIEEEFDDELEGTSKRYYASKALLRTYVGRKFVKKNGGDK